MQMWFCHSFWWDQQQVLTEVCQASCWAGLHGRHTRFDKAHRTKPTFLGSAGATAGSSDWMDG